MRLLAALVTAGATAVSLAAVNACGPPCVDDRCSLTPTQPQTTRVDYTKPASSTGTVTTGPGSAAPGSAGSAGLVAGGSGSAAPGMVAGGPAAGSGSAKPPAAGSAAPTAGSAAPIKPPAPPAVLATASWELWNGNQFKMYVISKTAVPANAKVSFDLVKTPTKTPFVITLEVRPPGGVPVSEGIWNDCPEGKIKCDPGGTKTHVTKKAGQVLLQAGINWTITSITDEGKGTLVTWTNNLSREVVQLRLLK